MVALPASDRFAPLLSILTRRRALVPILFLPAQLGIDPDDAAALLDDAVDAGLAEIWDEAPGTPCAILSAASARERGLELQTDGLSRRDRFRWVKKGKVKPEKAGALMESDLRDPFSGRGGFDALPDYGTTGCDMILVDVGEDPKLAPWLERGGVAAAVAERKEEKGSGRRRAPVSIRFSPRLILGLRPAWPVVRKPGEPCEGCGSVKLPDSAYCCACDASGLDDVLAPVLRHEIPKPYDPDGLAGGRGSKGGGKRAKAGKKRRAAG